MKTVLVVIVVGLLESIAAFSGGYVTARNNLRPYGFWGYQVNMPANLLVTS